MTVAAEENVDPARRTADGMLIRIDGQWRMNAAHLAARGAVLEWACNTYRAMLDGLRQLEGDLHQHIHKENNVLFPKAIQLESERRTSTGG